MYLYPIVDWNFLLQNHISLESLKTILGETGFFQLRIKNYPLQETAKIFSLLKSEFSGVKVIMNDYIDFLEEVDGLHLGYEDLQEYYSVFLKKIRSRLFVPARSIQEWLKNENSFLFGISTHNFEQFRWAIENHREYLSYLAIGPVFPTTTKTSFYPVVGDDTLESISRFLKENGINLSLVFIGGISQDNLPVLKEKLQAFFSPENIYYASISHFLFRKLPVKF